MVKKSLEPTPAPGFALVKVSTSYKGIVMPEAKYDTRTQGECISANINAGQSDWFTEIVGCNVYFSEFTEGKRITIDGVDYSFVKLDNIEGADIE